MATCFVIQPFDSGKFDKRFQDIYKPAIEAANLEAYRVDQDLGVVVPIEAIEKGIRQASICLADITSDNPNVWYELGFAFASERPVIMVCGEERTGNKYPFDIQHRSIISYKSDSPRDFEQLKITLTGKITALLKQEAVLEKIAEADPIAQVHGLSHSEVLLLAVIAGDAFLPDSATSVTSAKRSAENSGISNMGFNLALRRLLQKKLVFEQEIWSDHDGEGYPGLVVSDTGWTWIDANDSQFILVRPEKSRTTDPF